MAAFDVLQVRDLVALTAIASHLVSGGRGDDPADLVRWAYTVADAFVDQSESRWAQAARTDHAHGGPEPKQKP